jgi:hypothetical protein
MNDHEAFPWVPLLATKLFQLGVGPTNGKDIYIASDYSGSAPNSQYDLIGILVVDLENSRDWQTARLAVRRKFLADGRRMAFKNLNDGSRRAAIVPFLQSAELLTGACVVLAIDKRIKNFGGFEGIHGGMEERKMLTARWKPKSFRRMIDITHTVSALISCLCRKGQNIYWISDHDDCFASATHCEDTRKMMDIFSSMHVHFPLGEIALGTTGLDQGDRLEEDLASIPDIATGGLCEIVNIMHAKHGQIPNLKTEAPDVSHKSALIRDGFFSHHSTLRKAFCFVQPGPNGSTQLGSLQLDVS